MLTRAFRLAEDLAIFSLLTCSAVAIHLAATRARRMRQRERMRPQLV